MDITFKSNRIQKICCDGRRARRKHGAVMAHRLRQRLDDMDAAPTLEDLRPPFPGRCHELKADLAGQLSVDLEHPYRLIFRPATDPLPQLHSGGLDWSRIDAVEILRIDDTHE